ncbi:MAG: low temperature requirement protein A [Solirubrobacterales bacterium]
MSPYPAMSTATPTRAPRLTAVLREGERVTPLELFFDLVFVLALTQCTALMADQPTWEGLAKGLLVLGVLWWSWVGYAWLTSVVDPPRRAPCALRSSRRWRRSSWRRCACPRPSTRSGCCSPAPTGSCAARPSLQH